MTSGVLYTYPGNIRVYKGLIAAKYSGAKVTVADDFVFGETNKSAEFLKKFPLGKVPAFESADGKYLNGSNAIAFYLSNDQLKGKDTYEQARVIEWIEFADNVLLQHASKWVFPYIGIVPFNKQVVEASKNEIKKIFKYLDEYLLSRTYFVGERITLADIVLACTCLQLYQYVLDPSAREPYVNVNRWFTTIINQPNVKMVVKDFKFCDKPPVVETKKQGKTDEAAKKQEGKGGAEKVKKEKKKEEPKVEPEDELDEVDALLAAEPKSKDPFDSLPKGTFVMDDFKRFYSNEEVSKSIPYFWEKFDKENYSIWLGEYKYNNELEKVFMSCNLISGMFQRIERMRKQAFASVCLFGTDGNLSISGIWVWRGHELAFELSPDWKTDYDVYQWTKLNPDDENTKKLVQEYFSWTGKDKEGRTFNQGKIFK